MLFGFMPAGPYQRLWYAGEVVKPLATELEDEAIGAWSTAGEQCPDFRTPIRPEDIPTLIEVSRTERLS